jgi:hypothetical protein
LLSDVVQKRQRDKDADEPVEHVADRQPPACRIAVRPGLDQRVDGATEIGAQHKRKCTRRCDELRIGKRHEQQYGSDARMCRPGQRSRDDDAQNRIVCYGGKKRAHGRRLFGRRQRVKQDVQCQKDQP